MREDELEFVSVRDDDDSNNMNSTYVDHSATNQNDTVGNWFCTQSKVITPMYYLIGITGKLSICFAESPYYWISSTF